MSLNAKFLGGKVCLNVLANSVKNAQEIYEATEGHVVVGLLSKDYDTNEAAIKGMGAVSDKVQNSISVGLGAGDPNQWRMVAEISKVLQPQHINQITTAVGYTRGLLGQDDTIINALVSPTGEVGFVNLATGSLSSKEHPTKVPIRTAIQMLKEMGANSIKFFPMRGLKTISEYQAVCDACAELDFMVEPTGGLDLNNFREIVKTALDAGVKRVIPHVYSSIIDESTGKTRIEDVKSLYAIMKELV